jgi:hypothetical protein
LKYICKNISLLNIMLFGVMLVAFYRLVLPFLNLNVHNVIPAAMQNKSNHDAAHISKISNPAALSPSEYVMIAEQNLFHPDRKVPAEKKEGTAMQVLPSPEFVLYGTLVTDTIRVAYIEDAKSPRSTRGRGKRLTALTVGNSMSGFTLKQINEDKIIMARGEEIITIPVHNSNRPKKSVSAALSEDTSTHPAGMHETQKAFKSQLTEQPAQKRKPFQGEGFENLQFFQDYLKQQGSEKK